MAVFQDFCSVLGRASLLQKALLTRDLSVTFFHSFLLVCDYSPLAQRRNSFQESRAGILGKGGLLSHEGQIETERREGTPCVLLGSLLTWKETNLEPDSQVITKLLGSFVLVWRGMGAGDNRYLESVLVEASSSLSHKESSNLCFVYELTSLQEKQGRSGLRELTRKLSRG